MTQIRTVVAAALLDGTGRLLAARRSRPPELAGKWELPGGQVEAGESDSEALVRECHEELAVTVTLHDQVGGDRPLPGGWVLKVWHASVLDGEPRAGDSHSELRWLEPGTWLSVDWLPADGDLIVALIGCINPVS
jgi:8-oxo-dGTP diphosphatase